MVMWECSQWLWEEYCAEYWLKELLESMDGCTGCQDITKILFKMSLNTIQSINQGLMIIIVTGFTPVTTVQCFDSNYMRKQAVAWKEWCAEYWFEELESMDRLTGKSQYN